MRRGKADDVRSAERRFGRRARRVGRREVGPAISAADRRRWLDPCKGWPSAPAPGGFGLDKAPAIDISRRQEVERPGAGLRQTFRAAPRQTRRRPLDKKPHTSPVMTISALMS